MRQILCAVRIVVGKFIPLDIVLYRGIDIVKKMVVFIVILMLNTHI